MGDLAEAIRLRITVEGPIGFDEFVEHSLYAPGSGFYTSGGGAGRRRDFLTSPEVGPLFGAVVARAIDSWWDELGRPARLNVVDAGAGPGTLARCVLAAEPRCADSLALTLVERAAVQWRTHPVGVRSVAALPVRDDLSAGPVIVVANELLDNLAFALVERTSDGWSEVRVGLDAHRRFGEVLSPLTDVRARWCDERVGSPVPVGARIPVQAEATAWLADALGLARGGRVVVFDYADTSASMALRPSSQWLRTYSGHGRSGPPLEEPGSRDITCEVALDQLALVQEPTSNRTQADFLSHHGIGRLVEEGRHLWETAGMGGGLAAIAGRSRVSEAEALTDPAGLGAFRVLEWSSPASAD